MFQKKEEIKSNFLLITLIMLFSAGMVVVFINIVDAADHFYEPDINTVALWYLNDNGNDASGNGNHLTIKTDRVFWETGMYGQAAKMGIDPYDRSNCFNSDGGALTCAGSGCSYMGSGDWTIEAWVHFPSNSNPIYAYEIISHYSKHWGGHDPYMLMINNGVASFQIEDSSNNSAIVSADVSSYVGQWVHIAGVYRYQSKIELYVNGKLSGQLSTTLIPETLTNYDVFIGGTYCGTSTGLKVDEARISNIARQFDSCDKATYTSSTKKLHIPCVVVDGTQEYETDFDYVGNVSGKMYFKLNSAVPK